MLKRYIITKTEATCTNLDNAEWAGEEYIGLGMPDFYYDLDEAKAELAKCHAEITLSRTYSDGTKEYDVRFYEIDEEEIDENGDILDVKTVYDNYADLVKLMEEAENE